MSDEDIGDKSENLDSGGGERVEARDDGDHINVEDLKVVMNGMDEIIDRILGKVWSMDLSECNNNGLKNKGVTHTANVVTQLF